ncbi:hypothetical protein WR25_12819 [Diploscapter pachys]|uniref:Alpha-type protein kinase domain-containing protein n=1 Tax=Diploscapter pachys TaxID=2018661 RepID=A0A2A2KXJ4_9BILA|nr:hypothetical protein WR25_12819 [Diploscapter pachys]
MDEYILEVKNKIYRIIEKLTAQNVKDEEQTVKAYQLALVAYRDFGDKEQLEVLPFQSLNVNEFRSYCGNVRAYGGGDGAEDVFGGLEAALKLKWSPNYSTKVIFHIADAPCHGIAFHNSPDAEVDYYPEGDPNKRSHVSFFEEMNRVGIQFYFGKIRNNTNKMIEKFSEAYGKNIVDFDISQVDKIFSSIVTAVTDSVSHSLLTISATNYTNRELRSFNLSPLEPDWSTIEIKDCIFFTYEVPESIDDVINGASLERKERKKGGRIQVAAQPFAQGSERIAYYGKNVSTYRCEVKDENSDDDDPSQNLNNDMRAIRINRGRRSGALRMPTNPRGSRLYAQQIPHQIPQQIPYQISRLSPQYIPQQIPQQIAQYGPHPIPFNAMQSIPNPYPFPQPFRLNAPNEFHTPVVQRVPNTNNPRSHSSVNSRSPRGRGRGSRARGNDRSLPEKKFEINTIDELVALKEFKYAKTGMDSAARYHSLNYTQTIASYLAQKFEEKLSTKIQKEVTNGTLTVVDLQGIVSKALSSSKPTIFLTDPAIHCVNKLRFGQTNLGIDGIKRFFDTHECNRFCQALSLTNFKPKSSSSTNPSSSNV